MVDFTIIEIFNGVFCLIFVLISLFVGTKLILKYFKQKVPELAYVGITWIGLCNIWWSAGISFIVAFTNNEGLSPEMYFFLGNFLIPIAIITWVAAFTHLRSSKHQKTIIITVTISSILFYIFFFYFLAVDPSVIGERYGLINARYNLFQMGYVLGVLGVAGITGFFFVWDSLRSDDPEIKLKGKFLLIALISFILGSILDGLFTIDVMTLIIYKIILISSSVEFYFGFFLPNWIKKIFLKEK